MSLKEPQFFSRAQMGNLSEYIKMFHVKRCEYYPACVLTEKVGISMERHDDRFPRVYLYSTPQSLDVLPPDPSLRNPSAVYLDATPSYINIADAVPRVAAVFPKAKLLAVLRDPAKRALSAWNMVGRCVEVSAWNMVRTYFVAHANVFIQRRDDLTHEKLLLFITPASVAVPRSRRPGL